MKEPVFGVNWRRARVFWRVQRSSDELSQLRALEAASARLKKVHAEVERRENLGVLRFGYSMRAGRSWLAGIWGGEVQAVEEQGRVVVVTVAASPVPVLLYAGLGALAVGTANLGTAWLLGVVGLLLGGGYLSVHFGLLRVAEAVAQAAPTGRAA